MSAETKSTNQPMSADVTHCISSTGYAFVVVAKLEGDDIQEAWSSLNALMCNAATAKQEDKRWPTYVSETGYGSLTIKHNE